MRLAGVTFLVLLALTRLAAADFHSLLSYARVGNLSGVETMLALGVDPNPPTHHRGYAPLMFAAGNGNAAMTRLLLAHGAGTEHRDHNGERALLWATGHAFLRPFSDNAECVRLLLEAGSPADSDQDPYGVTPLMKAARYGGNVEMVRYLLAAGADATRTNQSDDTALHEAARYDRASEIVALLLEAGAAPSAMAKHLKETPLHLAAMGGATANIRLLSEAGAELEARQYEGETALFIAAGRGHVAAIEALSAFGADVDARAASGLTPVLAALTARYATDGSHTDAAFHLAAVTADIDRAFSAALWEGHPDAAGILLERAADIDAVDHKGRSALAGTTRIDGLEWFERLLAAGADLPRHGGEALREAAAAGRDDIAARLLDLDVSADARAGTGATALLLAAGQGRVSTVRLLLGAGADPATVDGNGDGAAQYMEAARGVLELIIAQAEGSRAWIDVSAERQELARLERAHGIIRELLDF